MRKEGLITMISYEEALEIAKEREPNIDECMEYENAYVFGTHEDDEYMGGYDHAQIVVMKEDGRLLSMPELVVEECGDMIRMFNLN